MRFPGKILLIALEATRMRVQLAVAAVGLGFFLVQAIPMHAHHSFGAEYDAKQPVTLKGTVTKFEWTNPHARFYIDVKGEDGKVTSWNLELASPNVLSRQGWTRHALQIGDVVTVTGSKAKDGSNMANAAKVTLADGRTVGARAAEDGGPVK
jgi:hypothetical protein